MTKQILKTTTVPNYVHSADCKELRARFDKIIDELIASSLSAEALKDALSGGIEKVGTILRSIPGHEGRLLERGIAMIARCNPDLIVLTQNLRLPVTPTALQLVGMNSPEHYRSLTLDADHGGRRTYTPDLIILNKQTKVAHVVDVKRSLISYENTRIDELKNRMLAAALVVPDLLFKEHRRLVAEEVRAVILSAEERKCDVEGGIWPLSHLAYLIEVTGAGEAIGLLKESFEDRINKNWEIARQTFTRPPNLNSDQPVVSIAGEEDAEPDDEDVQNDGEDAVAEAHSEPRLIKLGFAKVPLRH
ncbi:MAG: hypothetical protein COA37_00585 [Hoeflea sp.]|uniref:hypothetical protein n=1 Tax=Hoeflea sp. TaxID=1940281 RepID=UPI000C0D87E2|nr:hypothetical protein [Hoeflea sp.]PHR25378.1 MAG: hypothetical protein COA37_00585 [Hoeflea sp.]